MTTTKLPAGFTFAEYEGEKVFLSGARVEFAPGFTAILGESGTGKTTVVETLAYAVRPGEPASADVRGLVHKNLKGGLIRVGWRNEFGTEYTIIREPGKPARVLDANGNELAVPVEQLVRADFHSTHAMQTIACDANAQLDLLDRFVGDEMRDVHREIDSAERELRENAAKILELSAAAGSLRSDADVAKGLEEKLKSMQPLQGPDTALLQAEVTAKGLRERETEAFRAAREAIDAAQKAAAQVATHASLRLSGVVDDALVAGRNGAVMRKLSGHLRDVGGALEMALATVNRASEVAGAGILQEEKALAVLHDQQQSAYEKLIANNKDARDKDAERSIAQKQLAKSLAARKSFELRQAERLQVEARRRELLVKLSGLRDRRFELRKGVAAKLTAMLEPNIKVTVARAGSNDVYRDVLKGGLSNARSEDIADGKVKGSNMRVAEVATQIVDKLTPRELAVMVQRGDVERLADRTGLDGQRARKVISRLEDAEALYEIEMMELVDAPSIQLKDGEYKDVGKVSTGQKAAVLLPIVLLQGTHPIILDQPEEGLFAKFKATTVAKILREVKLRRQVIIVTHDAIFVVLPVADRVNEMGSGDDRGRVKSAGTMPEQRVEICDLVDGGEDAFDARMTFYKQKP
jgi:energy-coupling factor transporter ATP-binding protein EcfA2